MSHGSYCDSHWPAQVSCGILLCGGCQDCLPCWHILGVSMSFLLRISSRFIVFLIISIAGPCKPNILYRFYCKPSVINPLSPIYHHDSPHLPPWRKQLILLSSWQPLGIIMRPHINHHNKPQLSLKPPIDHHTNPSNNAHPTGRQEEISQGGIS